MITSETAQESPFSPLFIGSRNVTAETRSQETLTAIFQSPFHRVKECNVERMKCIGIDVFSFSPLFIGSRNVTYALATE